MQIKDATPLYGTGWPRIKPATWNPNIKAASKPMMHQDQDCAQGTFGIQAFLNRCTRQRSQKEARPHVFLGDGVLLRNHADKNVQKEY
eukprot:CAMPEP_0117479956 /NCGR_PEP_ID=MMETSP0784-20121206/12148_1 /TAXON_ID=39447 /ORGANISM="" /LENGTH=87 /DNA_ID=CAMNT_0005274391 /DNA_START=150 /DNA_END=410 /DNA_ORIENTATION=+